MANRLQKFLYFLTAWIPVLLVYAIAWLIERSKWDEPISINWKVPLVLFLVSLVLIGIFTYQFIKFKRDLPIIDVSGTGYKSADSWIIAYVISYLFPLVSFQFGNVAVNVVFIIVFFILLAALTFTDYVTPHPLLYVVGYHFYELEVIGAASSYMMISKKHIRNAREVKKVSRVFEFLLIRKG